MTTFDSDQNASLRRSNTYVDVERQNAEATIREISSITWCNVLRSN
jgi:hypothetical protein